MTDIAKTLRSAADRLRSAIRDIADDLERQEPEPPKPPPPPPPSPYAAYGPGAFSPYAQGSLGFQNPQDGHGVCRWERDVLRKDLAEVLDALAELLPARSDGTITVSAPCNQQAVRVLARHGRVKITKERVDQIEAVLKKPKA